MLRDVPERDWKVFRELQPIALERFCQHVLSVIADIAADTDKTSHQRYLAIHDVIRKQDQELADIFNDLRRSTALLHLLQIQSRGLLTEEEMARFSQETREWVQAVLSGR